MQETKVSYFSKSYIFNDKNDQEELPRIIRKTPVEEFYDRYDLELQWIEGAASKSDKKRITINWNDRTLAADDGGILFRTVSSMHGLLDKLYNKLSEHNHIKKNLKLNL